MPFTLLGAKVPHHFRSRERKFQGMNAPPMELSVPGAEIRGNESCSYQFPHLNHNTNLNFKSNYILHHICNLNANLDP